MAKESKKDAGAFSRSKDSNVEKALQQIAKEEAFILSNFRWRSKYSRMMNGKLINVFVGVEVVSVMIVGYGFWIVPSKYLTWKLVAVIVSPMFSTPALFFIIHLLSRTMDRMFDWIDRRELRKLRAKRHKLKEKTNDHTTQMYNPSGKSNGVKVASTSTGVRNRKNHTAESNGVEVASTSARVRNRKNHTAESNGVEVASTSARVRNRKAYVEFQGLRGKRA